MWDVSELLEARRALTLDEFAATHPCPVLVCRPRNLESADDMTVHSTESGGVTRARPEARLGHNSWVYCVRKRPGGTFPERIGIGRGRGTDVWIALPEVSKYHAYVVSGGAPATWAIADAGSSNGTFVDGQPVGLHAPSPLRNGCVVRFASHLFRFLAPEGLYAEIGELLYGVSRPRP